LHFNVQDDAGLSVSTNLEFCTQRFWFAEDELQMGHNDVLVVRGWKLDIDSSNATTIDAAIHFRLLQLN